MTIPSVASMLPSNFPLAKDFRSLDEIPADDAVSLCLYGGSGTGKTFFAGSAGPRTLFINIGQGIVTLKSPLFRKLYPEAGQMLVVDIFEKLGERAQPDEGVMFDTVSDTIDNCLQTAQVNDLFDTIVIDDASALRRGAMNKALDVNAKLGKSKSKATSDQYDFVSPGVQDYGTEMAMIEQFMAGYTEICKKAGKHLIVVAHERNIFKKAAGIGDIPSLMKTVPAFTGVDKNPDYVTKYFDNVWNTSAVSGGNERVYRIRCQGDETISAKSRYAGVFDTLENGLDFPKMLKRIKDSQAESTKLIGVSRKVSG